MPAPSYPRTIGRYVVHAPIASGGMATIHLGRMVGPVGFSRLVAIKRLHEHLAGDPEFVQMFLDEARIAARIQHPNAVSTLDIVELENELFLVMDYVQGESLSYLVKQTRNHDKTVPPAIAVHIMVGVLNGLHAAHEARDEKGDPLGIIHRDVTPQNVLVGVDGVPRIADFGIATAAGRLHQTREGQIKGKVQYMPPEQLTSKPTDRRADVYAASVVLWETLTGQKLFTASTDAQIMYKVLEGKAERPSALVKGLPIGLDAIVLKGLQRDPTKRYATAQEMALALEKIIPPISASVVGAWVREYAAEPLANAASHIQEAERTSPNERALALAQLPRVHSPSLPTASAPAPAPASPASPPVPADPAPVPAPTPASPAPPEPAALAARPLPPPTSDLDTPPAPLPAEELEADLLEELPPPGIAAPLDSPPLAPPRTTTTTPAPTNASALADAPAPAQPPLDELARMDEWMGVKNDTQEDPSPQEFSPARPVPRHRGLVLGILGGASLLLVGSLALRGASRDTPEPPTPGKALASAGSPLPLASSAGATSDEPVGPAASASSPRTLPSAQPPAEVAATSASAAPPGVPSMATTAAAQAPVSKKKTPKNKLYSRD